MANSLVSTDDTYQISIWSNVEAGLGIAAGSLTTLRPLVRFLKDGSSAAYDYNNRNRASYPLSSSVGRGVHRSSPSKHDTRASTPKFWAGELDDYHGVTTTIMSHHPHPTSSSEEDLNPTGDSWKLTPSIHYGR